MAAARAGLAELLADAYRMPFPAASSHPQTQPRSGGIGDQDLFHTAVGASSTPTQTAIKSVPAAAPIGGGGVAKKAEEWGTPPVAVGYTPYTDRSTVPLSGSHSGAGGNTDRFADPSSRYSVSAESQPHPLHLAAAYPTFGGTALPVPVAAPLRDLPIGGLVVPNYSLHQLAAEQQRTAEGLTAQLYAANEREARLAAVAAGLQRLLSAKSADCAQLEEANTRLGGTVAQQSARIAALSDEVRELRRALEEALMR